MPRRRSALFVVCFLASALFLISKIGQAQFGGGGGFSGVGQPATPPQAKPASAPAHEPPKPIKPIQTNSVSSPAIPFFPEPSEREKKLNEILDADAAFDFTDTSLIDCVRFLAEKYSIFCQIDGQALEEEAIPLDSPITFHCPEGTLSLRSAITMFSRPLKLVAFNAGGVLHITTATKGHETLTTRVYPVADLTDPDQPATFDELIVIIRRSTIADQWDDGGGIGSITPSHALRSLVIRTTREQHETVLELLTALRSARDTQ